MNKFIEVTTIDDVKVHVNIDHIVAIIDYSQNRVMLKLTTPDFGVLVNSPYTEFIEWLEKEMSK